MEQTERALSRTAAEQHGVFTVAQAAASGLTRRGVEGRAARGMYVRLHPSTYAVAASAPTWHRSVAAAVFSVNDEAAASHQTAAVLWGLTARRSQQIEVVTRRWDRVRRPTFLVHESKDLLPSDCCVLEGIPVTVPVRTVVDLGAVNRWLVPEVLDTGLRMKLFTLDEIDRFLARVARRGRRGVGVIRPLVAARQRWKGVTESQLEDLFRRVVDEAALPQPQPQFEVRDNRGAFVCRADFAYPQARVLIELDSEAFHMDQEVFQRDRAKQNRTLLLGWRTLRFTWSDLAETPERVQSVLADICAP